MYYEKGQIHFWNLPAA